MVNATSVLILILVLCFAADRIARALLMGLAMLPAFAGRFPDPAGIEDKAEKAVALRKQAVAHTVIVGVLAALILWLYPQVRILGLLTGSVRLGVIDVVVSAVVIMGGSDLISRLLQVSGVNEAMAAPGARGGPVEITGKLEIDSAKAPSSQS
jgi:uncharacterized membrane protein YvlD (DUF360 family)